MRLQIPDTTLAVDLSQDTPKVYSSKTMHRLVDNLAGALTALNLPAGKNIGLLGYNSVPMLLVSLALFKAPQMCVPLNYKLPQDKLHACIHKSNIGLIFCDQQFEHLVPDHVLAVQFGKPFDAFCEIDYDLVAELEPDKLYLSLFSSGTTGEAKKIDFTVQDRLKIVHSPYSKTRQPIKNLTEQTKTLCANPFFHNAGISWAHRNIFAQSILFVLPKFDAPLFLKTIEKYKIQQLNLVTPMMAMLLTESELINDLNLSSVTHIDLPSSFASASLIENIKKVFPSVTSINNLYGLTEIGTTIFATHPDNIPVPPGSTGYPRNDIEIKLVENELQVKCADFFSRYDTNGAEWFSTKDLFRVDSQGFYYYIGRKDDMFKCGGEKVYPIEIESVLLQHPCVQSCVVIGWPDEIKGNKPYAFVQLSSQCDTNELMQFAVPRLASYQIPKQIWIIDHIPINEIGKIDKKYLLQLAEQYIQS
jgi:long-chain acyl-CoA synthetase